MFPQRRPATQGVLSAASGPAIVFLSYAHEDREFALRLNDTLHRNGIQVHGDWELVRGENYEQQLQDLQTGSDATIVVLSPDWIHSAPCRAEFKRTVEQQKPALPVVWRDIDEVTDELPEELRLPQWTYLRAEDDFVTGVRELGKAVNTDFDLMPEHRHLLHAAETWDKNSRSAGYLLRGKSLKKAEEWLTRTGGNPNRFPKPTALQLEYIRASQGARTLTWRIGFAVIGSVAVAMAILALVARMQRNRAEEETGIARAQTQIARQKEAEASAAATAARQALVDQILEEGNRTVADDPGQAVTLAFAARDLTGGLRAADLLRAALRAHPVYRRITPGPTHGEPLPSTRTIVFNPEMTLGVLPVPPASGIKSSGVTVGIVDLDSGDIQSRLDIGKDDELIGTDNNLTRVIAVCRKPPKPAESDLFEGVGIAFSAAFSALAGAPSRHSVKLEPKISGRACSIYEFGGDQFRKPVLKLDRVLSIALANASAAVAVLDAGGMITIYHVAHGHTTRRLLQGRYAGDHPYLFVDPDGDSVIYLSSREFKRNITWIKAGGEPLTIDLLDKSYINNRVVWASAPGEVLLLSESGQDNDLFALDFRCSKFKRIARLRWPVYNPAVRFNMEMVFTSNASATRVGILEREEQKGDPNQEPQGDVAEAAKALENTNQQIRNMLQPIPLSGAIADTTGYVRFYDLQWHPDSDNFVTITRQSWTVPLYPAPPTERASLTGIRLSPNGEYVTVLRENLQPGESGIAARVEIFDLMPFNSEEEQTNPFLRMTYAPIAKRLQIPAEPTLATYSADGGRLTILDTDAALNLFKVKTGRAASFAQDSRAPEEWDRFFDPVLMPIPTSKFWLVAYNQQDWRIYDYESGRAIPIPMQDKDQITPGMIGSGDLFLLTRSSAFLFHNQQQMRSRRFESKADSTKVWGDLAARQSGRNIELIAAPMLATVAEFELPDSRPRNLLAALEMAPGRYRIYTEDRSGVSAWETVRGGNSASEVLRIPWASAQGMRRKSIVVGDLLVTSTMSAAYKIKVTWFDLRTGKETQLVSPPPGGWPQRVMIDNVMLGKNGERLVVGTDPTGEVNLGVWPPVWGPCMMWKTLGRGVPLDWALTGGADIGFVTIRDIFNDDDDTGWRLVRLRDGTTMLKGHVLGNPYPDTFPPPPLTFRNGTWMVDDQDGYDRLTVKVLFGGLDSSDSITNVPPPPSLAGRLDLIRRYSAKQTTGNR